MTKKILYHHRTQGKGVEGVHIRGMVDGFRALGYTVNILSPPGVDPYRRVDKGASTAHKKISILTTALRKIADNFPQVGFEILELSYNFYSYLKVYRQLKSGNYHFIYERYALFGLSCALLAKRFKIPLVLEVNDATLIERSRPLVLRQLARYLEDIIFHRSSMIITITGYFKRLILRTGNFKPETILVLPNAVDPVRFELGDKGISREGIGIHNKFVIGVVGAFVPWHGLDFLIEATHDLLTELDIHVLLVGDGPVRENVEALANKHEVTDYVTITGFLSPDQVPYYIDLMDICLMPGSNKHCSPVKLFEYMAMGKPSVVPRYDPIEEVVNDGDEVFIFQPSDREGFRQKISFLIQNEEIRTQMGRKAKETVFKKYVWKENISKLDDKLMRYI